MPASPVYLGVTSDRTLSYRQHLTKTAGNLQSRNNLLMKLVGSSWGANANTLRSSALALPYSVAEYCCPVWERSTHVSLVDAQLPSSTSVTSRMTYRTSNPGLVCHMLACVFIVLLFIRAPFWVLLVLIGLCSVFWLFWLSCQYLLSD